MKLFYVDIGIKELYTLKNFSFDIVNSGSADITVLNVTTTENIKMDFISTPFSIIKDSVYNINGYIKIVNINEVTNVEYIDFYVSYNNGSEIIYETYRYYINYVGVIYNLYTQIIEVYNINYINNMLVLLFESDSNIEAFNSIVIISIDNVNVYIYPQVYKLSNNKIIYTFKDNYLKNKVIDNSIKFFISNQSNSIEINKMLYRSI